MKDAIDRSNKPRVLLVGPFPPAKGGVTSFMRNLMASPLKERFDFVPFDTARPAKADVVDSYGYAAMFRGGIARLLLVAALTLRRLVGFPRAIRRMRIDLVQIQSSDFQTFWESCLYLWLARRAGRRTLMRLGGVFDHFYETSSPRLQAWIRKGVAAPDQLIVQSEQRAAYLAKLGRTACVTTLPNSVPAENLVPVDAPRCDPPAFVYVAGSEATRKGAEVLISALGDPALVGIPLTLRCVAIPRPLRDRLEVADPEGRVRTQGFVEHRELLAMLREADVFLLPSLAEGFPNSLLEAAAAGLAPIVTPVGSVPEIFTDEQEALSVAPGDAGQLARAMARLATDAPLRRRLAQSAQDRVRREFLTEVVFERLATAYRGLLEGERA
jgi:glycosyltransferase involved in cell wall biosynthesis